jgi:hypothetical protein
MQPKIHEPNRTWYQTEDERGVIETNVNRLRQARFLAKQHAKKSQMTVWIMRCTTTGDYRQVETVQ